MKLAAISLVEILFHTMPPKRLTAEVALSRILEEESGGDDGSGEDMSDENEPPVLIDPVQDEESEDTSDEEPSDEDGLKDKDGQIWSANPPHSSRRGSENIFRGRVGPTPSAFKTTILGTWQLFFPESLSQKI